MYCMWFSLFLLTSPTLFLRNIYIFFNVCFDVISDVSDMTNKCIQNDIKTLCFFVFAFKMFVSKPKRQLTDRTLKEKIEILGKFTFWFKSCRCLQKI